MKTNIKRFSKRSLAMLLSILMIVSAFFVMGTVTAYAGTNWNANIFFRVPDSWNLSTYPNVQAWAVQSSSASSGTKYAFLLGNMSVAGTTSNSRLYHAWVSANHSSWRTEYIAFTANTSNWGTGDFYISTCGQYTAPLNYGATNSSGSYLFSPSNASNNTAANNNTMSGEHNGNNREVLKKNQDFYVYTNGSSSATGGSVKVDAYYVNGSSYSGSSAIATSSITVNSSDSGAHEQYGGAVQGTKVTMKATAATGYDFDGYYDAATGGNLISSDATYSYYVFGAKSVYARFKPKTYTITYNKGANGTGTVASTTKTHGVNATLSSSTFTRSGYTQTGWSTSDGGSKAYNLGGTYSTNADATLYPYWTQNTYAITLSETGGSGTMKIDGTTRSSGYAVTHGKHTFTVTAPTGKVVKSISGIGTWSGEGTETASLGSTSIASAKTITVEYEDAGTCGFTLSKSSTTLNIGGTDTITVTPNAYHSGGTISATSSNTSVATVSYNTSTNKATITAKSHGTATITISCTEGGSATISVTVNTPTISIALGSSSLNIGGTTTITPTVTNQGTATVTYTSSNTSVATISGTTITAVAPGTTNITATVDGVTSTAKTLTVNTPTINVTNNTTIKVGATYTPSATLTNPSTASGKWTVDYVKKSGTTATTNGTTITAVNYGSKTTFTAQYKYDGTVVATKDFDVTPVTPSISAYSYSAINVGGTANPSVTKSNVDNMTVSYSIKSGSAVTINSTSGQITGVVPTASNATTVTVTYTYGSCSVSRDATVTVNTPSITQGNVTIAKGDSKTLSTATTNPSSGLTVTFALSGSPNGVTCTSAGVVTVAQNSTASTATVVATAKNSGGTTVATKSITVTIETPTLTVKDGSTSVADGTVYTTVGTNKALTVGQNFSGDVTAKSANTSIATVSLNNGTLTITPVAKGTTKVSVSTDSGYTPTNAPAALLSASPLLLLGATPSVATQTVEFTVNVAEAETYKYLYFTNGVGWSGVKAYLYGDGSNASFPGESMVKIGKNEENKDVYAIRYPATKNYNKVIISNASDNSKRVQLSGSSDLALSSSQNAFWCNTANNDSGAGQWNCTIVKPQIQANDVTIDMGSTQTMTATVLNNVTPSTFNWSSGTTSIATTASTTTASNVISGVAPGTSTITVKAYAAKPSGWNSIVTDGTADDYVAGTATATATVVAENKTVTFGAKKTDDGSTFTDLSGAVTAKYYDADTSGSGSSGSGSGSSGSSGSDPEPSGGPYYLHIGRQNDFVTNEAIEFTWNGSYYYAEYTVETANTDYPFVINTKNTALGDSDKSASSQAVTTRAANYDPDNIYNNVFNYLGDYNTYSGYGAFKIIAKNANTKIYITFASTSAGVVYRSSITSSSGSSGGSSGSSGTSGEGKTMTSPQSVPYGKVAVFTAEATKTVSDVTYHFAEWVDGSGNKLSSDTPYQITVTADKTVYARYYKVFKLSAFDSYEKEGSTVSFKTSPPKSITVKHGDDIYTYRYDGTALPGNPDSPDEGITKPQALPVASGGTFGQGNYIQYYAGDEITLHYSAMSSSEIFKGVFYNNSTDYYVAKPTAEGFIAHDYTAEHTLYMNSAYYASVPSGLPTTTVDNDDHTIKFTGTKDFKNIDVEMATKRKVYFSDYTNAIIGSKNIDDYYYDGEALSVTGDQLTVKAAKSASQTNVIVGSNVDFYKATAEGGKGEALTDSEISTLGLSVTNATSTSTSSEDGTALVISGNMPSYDLYIDLGMTSSYTIKLGSKIMSDSFANKTRLAEVATVTITGGSSTLTAPNNADITSTSASVNSSTALTLSSTFTGSWGDYYMFVGWYWGSDTAPDFDKGFISDKASLSYTPKKGGTIWAVGTRNLYINGSKYITGKDNNWYGENNVQKNLPMSYDAASGRYYWEISDTMFAAAGYNYKTWKEENSSATTEYGRYHTGDDQNLYWYSTDDKYHGKAFFQLFDQESGNANKTIWDQITYFVVDEPANGPTYGKVYPPEGTYTEKQHNGQGFINFNESGYYAGQSSPLRIYFDPSKSGNARLTVESTKIYSNLYVSNGYTVGSTLKTSDVTVEPVVDGVVKTDGQSGYFSVGKQGNGWDPYVEGHVNHYKPQKKGATVRITKTVGGSDEIAAFFIYDITNKTVRAERDVKKDGSKYYIDLTLANSEQNLYIVPIVEEDGANVTVTFDATQLNRKQWGDIVTAYAWYQNNGGAALGDYPGQPMIPSDDMTTWTAKFKGVKNSKKLEGITFSNYVDGAHSWLGCSGVMGSVSDHKTGTASGGIVNVYNHISSGTNGEYSRTNFKAQTYDYREPIALYDRFKNSDNVSISFSMKDGNSSLISWKHNQLLSHNIVTLEPHPNWDKLNWEYLTNAKGDKYIDLNGNTMKTKPTASFYIAAKGQVLYNSSSMTNVFYSGKQYDAVSGVTYGGASGVSMNYAVQWYVYDAQGNYITNVLTAGIADMSTNGVDSYIGKVLEDKGYAVDGKSVSICYDKPRYMYSDSNTASSGQAAGYNGKGINVGDNFDAYRFTGQWNAVASNELVKVNVGVGMMTDSGEVLASSNTAGYGNASATYDTTKGNNTRVTDEDGNEAPFTASDNSFVRTAVRDAENSPVKLNASAQNFIGWYYYDANTGDFVKANYASNENFYPNYSNKDVKFYAMYRASAVYQYKYTGREGARTYSAAGNDLSEYELGHGSVIRPADHEADIKLKVPVGIGIFKENIDFTPTNYNTWTKTADSNGYVLDITGFATSTPTYTLTAYYKDTDGDHLATKTKTAVYNGSAVNLTDLNGGTPVTSYHGKPFLGWYAYDGGTIGELISTQTNYGLRLTRNQAVIAVYGEDGSSTVPEASQSWHVSIDENEVNKELTTSDTGVYYNDTIVRVRNGADVRATLPSGAKIGVLVVCDNKTNETINGYTPAQLTTLANAVTSGSTKKTAKGLSITNMQATSQTTFNRTDIAVRRDYKTTLGAKYCVYAYIKDGSTYTFSDVSAVKTYE